jgi:uncharacterized protein with GYD domain
MSTFFMFGKYSSEAIKEMSAERTKKIINFIEKCSGKVNSMHALLGEYDLVFITDFPGMEQAMKASVGLTKLTGIAFSTSPAVTVAEFDKLTVDI